MKIIFAILSLYLILFSNIQSITAQQKDSSIIHDSIAYNDSQNVEAQIIFNKKLEEIELQRKADSVKKAELETQINSLQTTDNLQKEELQKQLQDLKDSESTRLAQKKEQINSMRLTAKAFPVEGFFKDTLFLIYSKLGSFSAKDRANAISKRINKLSEYFNFSPDSLVLAESEDAIDLIYRETIIMTVSENDALWNSSTKHELAQNYQQIISDAVMKYKSETSFITLLKEIGLALLVLLIIFLLIKYILKFFNWVSLKIQMQEGKLFKGIVIKDYTLIDAGTQTNLILTANKIFKWFIILLVIYIALPILFGIFPWTKDFAVILFGYILNPVKRIAGNVWDYLPNLITIIVIVFLFRYVLKAINFFKSEIENGKLSIPGFYPDWANPTFQLVRVLIFAFMLVVIFPYLPGSDSPVFQGVTVFLGFLFTFGSAGSLSNIISGLVMTYMRLFKIGDRVKIGDVVGDVIEKSLLVTRVRSIKNEIISIPNTNVMNSHTINYSSDAPDKGLIIHTTVTIGYDVPWRDMQNALIDAALKTNMVLHEPKPFVLQTSLDDFYVSYQINAYIREANKQSSIYSNLHQNIQDVCNERGIEIMSAHYGSARDGNRSTIPADYLPKDYSAPGFNVNVKIENDNQKKPD